MFSGPTYSETIGLIEGLEKLISIDREKYKNKAQIIASNPKQLNDLNGLQIYMDEDFILSLMFHSDPNYLALTSNDICRFYTLLDADLLKTANGVPKNIMVYSKKDETSKESAIITKEEFLKLTFDQKCQKIKNERNNFTSENLKATISKETFKIPTNQKSCDENYKFWIAYPGTPYYCSNIKKINAIEKLKKKVTESTLSARQKQLIRSQILEGQIAKKYFTDDQYRYLRHLCDNLANRSSYCDPYQKQSYWNKILVANNKMEYLRYPCQGIVEKNTLELSKGDLESCVQAINKNNEICSFSSVARYPSLTPKPSCKEISLALNNSKLFANYKDCPGNIDNEGIINISRILMHFAGKEIDKNQTMCNTNPSALFAKLTLDSDNDQAWNLRLCYPDKINNREACIPTIMGQHTTSEYSEDKVIAEILYQTRGTSRTLKCNIIEEGEYKPHLLQYKSGCFVIYKSDNCSATNCPKKIILDEREITHIKYKGDIFFDYFPNSFSKDRYSINSNLIEQKKFKMTQITNFTELKRRLTSTDPAIAHGVGCLEDILPNFFKKVSFNQCTPMAFILDGVMQSDSDEDDKMVITRTALDDLHSPRIVKWNNIFNAIKNFQQFHPLNSWTLYAIY